MLTYALIINCFIKYFEIYTKIFNFVHETAEYLKCALSDAFKKHD